MNPPPPSPPDGADDAPQQAPPHASARNTDVDAAEAAGGAAPPPPEANDEAPSKPPYVAELEAKLAKQEARLNATLTQYKEALDEFTSTKARLRRDLGKEIDAGKQAILCELLDVVDNLERAIEAAPGDLAGAQTFFDGVRMVRDQFLQKLEHFGVRQVNLLHQPFNPQLSEAVSTVPVQDPARDGQVVGVIRTCYVTDTSTLRHGMVAVGTCPAAPAPKS